MPAARAVFASASAGTEASLPGTGTVYRPFDMRRQRGQEAVAVFGVQHAHDEVEALLPAGQPLGQHAARSRVVAAIEPEFRRFRKPLQPRRPVCIFEAAKKRRLGQAEAFETGKREAGIACLVRPGEAQLRQGELIRARGRCPPTSASRHRPARLPPPPSPG